MSYMQKYKVGTAMFRTLAEARLQFNVLKNTFRFSDPAPTGITTVQEYINKHSESSYTKVSNPLIHPLPSATVLPAEARSLLEREDHVDFQETFVLRVPNGRVLGEGTSIVEGNAILADTTTDFHRHIEHHHLLSERKIPQAEHVDGRLAVISSPGSDNYFHWTLDSVPRFGLLKKMVGEIDAYYVDDRNRFHREWLDILGIPSGKIFTASPMRHMEATELIIPSFAGLPGLPSPEGLDFVREFMPETEGGRGDRIYISRSGSRRRRILNEAAMLPILEQHGFSIVHPGKMSVAEQMNVFSAAKVIVSPHGAELTNLVYCQPETKVIEFFSPYYLNPCFKKLCAIRGLKHTALVGQGGSRILRGQKDAHHVWANIKVNIRQLTDEISCLE